MSTRLLKELRDLIQSTRAGVAQAVNAALVLLYWQVGHRIRTEILKSERAEYGERIVPTPAVQLALEFGQGFAEKNLRRMIQLAEVFPEREIVVTLSRQLGWSHFLAILPLKDPLRRDFYAEMGMADTHELTSCEAGTPVQMPPPGSSRGMAPSRPRGSLAQGPGKEVT